MPPSRPGPRPTRSSADRRRHRRRRRGRPAPAASAIGGWMARSSSPIGGGRQRLAVAHGVDGTVLWRSSTIDAVVAVIGIHPVAEIFRHPVLVAGLGDGDGIVPDGDAFLLAHERRELVLDAVGDEDASACSSETRSACTVAKKPKPTTIASENSASASTVKRDLRGQRPLLARAGSWDAVVRSRSGN